MLKINKTLAIATTFLLMNSTAMAQVEDATRSADPSRISEELMDFNTLPTLEQKVDVKGVPTTQAPQGAENIRFVLNTLEIQGVGAYAPEEIAPYYNEKLGTNVSLAEIYGIANDLTVKYRNDGYILTQVVVPPQTIDGGKVELRVVEGFVDQIIIQGASEKDQKQIQKYAENLRENGILDAKQLERYLLLINDLPGVDARSVLSPSKSKTGGSDLTIIVERDRYDAEVSIDNHGTRYLGPYRASYTGSMNSILGYNERITTRFVMAGDKDRADEMLFGAVYYDQPISRFGSMLHVSAGITDTEPGDSLDEFDVEGKSKTLRIGVSHPFIRSRTVNFTGRANFDIRNTQSENNLEPDDRKDKLRSVRVGATYQFMDTMLGVGVNAIDFELSKGTGLFGASQKGDANLTRARGVAQYFKGNLQVERLQRVNTKVNLLLTARGQLSAHNLLSAEEFGVGGISLGRGYDSSEIVGENGIAGKVEVQWNKPKPIPYIHDYQLFAFFDAGRVWNTDATTSAGKRESISSTGFGFRADITEDTEAGFGVAFPLTRNVDVTDDRDPRYYFNVTHKF